MQRRKSLESVRTWENVSAKSNGNTIKFNVVSYNVLAQCLLEEHPYLYSFSAPSSLKWSLRSTRLYNEIIDLEPDIVCLQEVQQCHLDTFYSRFEELGYSGIFKKKTGPHLVGCAIYFRNSMFEIKDKLNVEFFQPNMKILNRDNIGLMVKLSHRDRGEADFVVATTHLLYNPKRSDVRLAQMRLFLAEIERFAYYNTGSESGYLPIILTGDLNAFPETATIQLLDKGNVIKNLFPETSRVYSSEWQQVGVTQNCQHLSAISNRKNGKITEFSDLKIYNSEYSTPMSEVNKEQLQPTGQQNEVFMSEIIGHPFNFSSVYPKYKPDGSSEVTTFQGFWVTVDYMYYSQGSALRVIDRLRLPSEQECAAAERLPNNVCGSDHFVLAAIFEFTPKEAGQ